MSTQQENTISLYSWTENGDRRVSIMQLINIMLTLADSIAGFHANKIVHRDIGPDTIMIIDKDMPTAYIVDDGTSCMWGESCGVLDTHYMAPELESKKYYKYTGKQDVYNIACVYSLLFNLLDGSAEFDDKLVLKRDINTMFDTRIADFSTLINMRDYYDSA